MERFSILKLFETQSLFVRVLFTERIARMSRIVCSTYFKTLLGKLLGQLLEQLQTRLTRIPHGFQ